MKYTIKEKTIERSEEIEDKNIPLSECCNSWFFFKGFYNHDDTLVECSLCHKGYVL